jgi:hypothetical protein
MIKKIRVSKKCANLSSMNFSAVSSSNRQLINAFPRCRSRTSRRSIWVAHEHKSMSVSSGTVFANALGVGK